MIVCKQDLSAKTRLLQWIHLLVSQSHCKWLRIRAKSFSDLASMQYYQHSVRQNSASLRYSDSVPHAHSPAASRSDPELFSGSGTPSLPRGSVGGDTQPGDAPTATVQPRSFKASSLSKEDLNTISELTKQLSESTYLYNSHINLIRLLRRGFLMHISPQDDPETLNDPSQYALLEDLRQARDAMDSRFPVGEEFWVEWLQDECMLAESIEDRVSVIELCKKAVHEEVGSVPIWRFYGDYMWLLYKRSQEIHGVYQSCSLEQEDIVGRVLAGQSWAEEDMMVGKEVFSWEQMMDVWQQAIKATEWHINDSHVIWFPFMDLVLHDFNVAKANTNNPDSLARPRKLFMDRLRQPHSAWEETFQMFSSFVSRQQNNESYEHTMVEAKTKAKKALHEFDLRQEREFRLAQAAENQDRSTEWEVFAEYLEWEAGQHKKKTAPHFSRDIFVGLIERANLRFPSEAEFWEDHIDLTMEHPRNAEALLFVAQRATRHCPWAGSLWARRLSALEASRRPFAELEDAKHRATSSGLLEEVGGMDELIKVYTAWCGFLRRRAFAAQATEDERDIAEIAIKSAIEDVGNIGEKRFGKDFKGDPYFRTERLYLKFLAQAGQYDEGRTMWQKLSITHGDHYEFWSVYYLWEMVVWGIERGRHATRGGPRPSPELATSVLQRAIRRPNLDWPEKLIEAYLHHCSQHETVERLQEAQMETRRASRQVVKRRSKEAAETFPLKHQPSTVHQAASSSHPDAMAPDEKLEARDSKGKRKRANEMSQDLTSKRARQEDVTGNSIRQAATASSDPNSQLKRDRENTTIVVRHLPASVTESQVRKFFRDCGKILALNIVPEDKDAATATIEFESKEDVLTAHTKGMKSFEGHFISITEGTRTTLWVTNYPAEADEQYIRSLFEDYGEIVEVRFPSLKVNTHRRFCYVQFLTSKQAENASHSLDGKSLGGNLRLSAKISDPSARKQRTGATQEGREVYVGNLDWSASETDVTTLFSESGNIESCRIPRNAAGKSKGAAFLIFSSQHEAQMALTMNLRLFKDRVLTVDISKPKAAKHQATTVVNETSPDAALNPDQDSNATPHHNKPHLSSQDASQRTVALLNVPDTVNDARLRRFIEPHASFRKIVLRPDHEGAIVELANAAEAGKLSMSLDGREISPRQPITVGTVAELMEQRSGTSSRQISDGSFQVRAGKNFSMQPAPRRPGLGARGRVRGPRIGAFDAALMGAEKGSPQSNGAEKEEEAFDRKGKSQADFRAMLDGSAKKDNINQNASKQ